MVSEIVTLFVGGKGIEREDFQNGLQRVLNRVPRRGSTTEPSFFPYFFLGSVLTLPYTELNDEIGIKGSSVKIISKETIKLAFRIEEDGETKLVFRTIAAVKKIQDQQHLAIDELKEALGSFDLTEDELNNCEVEGEIVHIKDGEVNLKTLEVLGKGELNSEMLKNLSPLPGYNEETAKFKKVKDGIIEKDSLGNALKQFSEKSLKASRGEKLSTSSKGVGALFENLSKVYRSEIVFDRGDKSSSQKLGLSDYEAPAHGFVYGALAMNFRYEYALRIRAEQAAGKGFVDLVVGSNGLEFRVELKGHTNTAQDAERQSGREGYDKAPIIFSFGEEEKAKSVTMVFANLCLDPNSGGLLVEESKVLSKPEGLSKLFKEHNDGILDDEGLKRGLKEKLNYLYYSISDSNGGGENTNYLSRLILGELLSDGSGLEKHVFIYGSKEDRVEPTEIVLRGRTVAGKPLVTLANTRGITLVLKFTDDKSLVVNVIENAKFNREKSIPLDGIGINHSKCKQVNIKVNLEANGGFEVEDDKGKSYYQGIEIGGVTSFGNKYEGKLEKIKRVVLQDITDITRVRDFREALFPLRKLITLENHFQAIVQGLLSAQKGVEVLTEANYSSKGKPDLLISHRGKDGKIRVAAVELKLAKTEEEIEKRRKEGEDQLKKRADGLETITKEEKVEAAVLVVCPSVEEDKFITFKREGDLNVGHSSRGSSDGEPSPKRKRCLSDRRKRNIGMSCVDSRDKEGIEERDRKEKLVSELFDRDKIREIKENFEFYNQLFEISDQISKGGTINEDARKALKAKVKDIDINLIDPEIKGIVAEIKNKISRENANKGLEAILRESGVAEKIGKVAEGAGLAFTVFLVSKHIANGNIEGLGYDALNLLIMPKIGEKISGKILELGTKLDSQMLKGFAPVMGRAIGNFAAFLGLAESIKARQNAKDPVDMKIADLNIATNSIFIAADVPAVVTETMSVAGLETGVVGEFAGPVGVAVSVAVIIISQFVEAELEVQKLEEQINLTDQEKHDLYWDFFLGMKMPEYIEHDIEAKKIYEHYISSIIDKSKDNFDTIAISLPGITFEEKKYTDVTYIALPPMYIGVPSKVSTIRTETTNHELDFLLNTKVDLSNIGDARSYSRVIPEKIQSYGIICGPTDQNIQVAFSKREITRERKKWSLDTYPNDCNNAVVYNDKGSNKHRSLCYMESQSVEILTYENSNITVVFGGNNILVNYAERNEDVSHSTENRYHFSRSLKNCTVHKPGDNFFYITGNEFSCNLKREGQKNIVVTQGNFTDSENIHSIVGNNGTNHIEVSYAGYVDGQGGNDVITAKNSPVIKGYFGDNIYGKGVTVLPIALRDISKMILEGNRNTIYSKDGNLTIHGKEMLMKTRDGFFVTATKIDSRTKMVTDLHVVNYNGTEVLEVYDDSIQKLILYFLNGLAFGEDFKNVGSHFMHKLFNGTHLHKNASGSVFADNPPLIIELALEGKFPSNPNFKTTRQMFSKKLDVVIGDYGHHVFYADRQSHFFYWEGAKNAPNLYLFDDKNVTVIINKGNGLLDFSMVKSEEKYKVEVEGNAVFVVKGNVSAVLPMNYKNITVTFDQKEYYKLQGGKLERDYCSHRLKIDESFRVNSTDLLNYNCLTFDTDKVFFLRLGNDLQLVSNKEALSILDYYKPDSDAPCTNGLLYIMGMEECADSLDLSIELSNRIIEREEFRKRADNPSTFKYYEPGKVGLKIYHNQPVNKNDVGLVDLKGKFILDLDMEIIDDSLFLLHKNNTLVKVENWNTYQPAREMMFAFNDGVVFNAKCIVSSCGPEDTIREFQEKKVGFLNEYLLKAAENGNLDRVKYLLSRGAYIDARDHKGVTPLYFSCSRNHLDVVEFLLDQGANANAVANTWTPLQTATAHGFLKIVQLILNKRDDVDAKRALEVVGHFSKENESKIKNLLEERVRGNEETIQHHIRHKRHKQHHRKHLQKKGKTDAYRHRIIENDSSAIESNQATSGASKPSSWINVFANSVVDAVKSIRQFIFSSFKPAIDMQTSRAITTEGTDVNGTILLLDVFIRKFTGQKYISSNTRGITEQEALGYVLSVTEKFREVVEQAALKSSISIHRLNIDFMKIQEEITGKIISGKFNEISGILKSYAEKACPGREAGCSGRLSQKKYDKFMTEFNSIIDPVINQPMQQILSRLKASNVKEQLSLEPRSYLNNASVQGHLTQDRDLRKQGKVLIP